MDKIAIALHHACDQRDVDVAMRLVQIMDRMITERPLKADGTRRLAVATLVEAHEHLWQVRFGGQTDGTTLADALPSAAAA